MCMPGEAPSLGQRSALCRPQLRFATAPTALCPPQRNAVHRLNNTSLVCPTPRGASRIQWRFQREMLDVCGAKGCARVVFEPALRRRTSGSTQGRGQDSRGGRSAGRSEERIRDRDTGSPAQA